MSADLESLISSTLNALDVVPVEEDVVAPGADVPATLSDDVDECLSKIREAAPQVASNDKDDSLSNLLDGLLSPNAILESMEGLATELAIFLEGKEDSEEIANYRRQLAIYEEISVEFKKDSNVAESKTPAGDRVRQLLEELQSLGSPPVEVVEKLMSQQLQESGDEDIGKEFEEFLKAAGGSFPGMTKEDEDIIKQLTQDPNALKNLLGANKPGDCVIS